MKRFFVLLGFPVAFLLFSTQPSVAQDPEFPNPLSPEEMRNFVLVKAMEEKAREEPNDFQIHSDLAFIYGHLHMWDEAIRKIRWLMDREPRESVHYNNLAWAYLNLGFYSRAERFLRRGLHLDPGNPFARYNLAVILQAQEKSKEAIVEYKKLTRLYPDNDIFHFYFGNAYLKWGRYDEAIEQFLEVLRINPKDGDALRKLGLCYAVKGDKKKAERYVRKCLDLNSEDGVAQMILDLIEGNGDQYDDAAVQTVLKQIGPDKRWRRTEK